eukprot:6183446-Pleurochrysis_carterae.AAC.1
MTSAQLLVDVLRMTQLDEEALRKFERESLATSIADFQKALRRPPAASGEKAKIEGSHFDAQSTSWSGPRREVADFAGGCSEALALAGWRRQKMGEWGRVSVSQLLQLHVAGAALGGGSSGDGADVGGAGAGVAAGARADAGAHSGDGAGGAGAVEGDEEHGASGAASFDAPDFIGSGDGSDFALALAALVQGSGGRARVSLVCLGGEGEGAAFATGSGGSENDGGNVEAAASGSVCVPPVASCRLVTEARVGVSADAAAAWAATRLGIALSHAGCAMKHGDAQPSGMEFAGANAQRTSPSSSSSSSSSPSSSSPPPPSEDRLATTCEVSPLRFYYRRDATDAVWISLSYDLFAHHPLPGAAYGPQDDAGTRGSPEPGPSATGGSVHQFDGSWVTFMPFEQTGPSWHRLGDSEDSIGLRQQISHPLSIDAVVQTAN